MTFAHCRPQTEMWKFMSLLFVHNLKKVKPLSVAILIWQRTFKVFPGEYYWQCFLKK